MQALPSQPAAHAYLEARGAKTILRYNGTRAVPHGYQVYFTVVLKGDESAVRVKVCETKKGKPTGWSNISRSDPSC